MQVKKKLKKMKEVFDQTLSLSVALPFVIEFVHQKKTLLEAV